MSREREREISMQFVGNILNSHVYFVVDYFHCSCVINCRVFMNRVFQWVNRIVSSLMLIQAMPHFMLWRHLFSTDFLSWNLVATIKFNTNILNADMHRVTHTQTHREWREHHISTENAFSVDVGFDLRAKSLLQFKLFASAKCEIQNHIHVDFSPRWYYFAVKFPFSL